MTAITAMAITAKDKMTGMTITAKDKEIIDNFFAKNYDLLLKISKDYCNQYQNRQKEYSSLISDIYIHTLECPKRMQTFRKLIESSAATLNYVYNNLAFFNIIKIIYCHASSGTNILDRKKRIKLEYYPEIFNSDYKYSQDSQDTSFYDMLGLDDIMNVVDYLAKQDNNYWKAELWRKHNIDRMTITALSEYYTLPRTPIFMSIRSFNNLVKSEINKVFENKR